MYQPGSTTITITAASTTGDFQVPSNVNCVLNPGNSGACGFGVTFTPTATGTRTGTLSIYSTGGTQYVSLVGTGVAGTLGVTITPASLGFAKQAIKSVSPYQSVTITNTGTATLDLTSLTLTGANSGEFVLMNEDCQSTIAPGANCFVEIGFQPKLRGARTASLTIVDNAPNSPQVVPLGGTGTANSLSASLLSFGGVPVGSSSSQTLTLTNVGSSATTINHVGVVGSDRSSFSESSTCPLNLAARASCTFTVTFAPQATGWKKASLTFVSNGSGKTETTAVPLSGTGK